MNGTIQIDVYSRPNCHLCDEAKHTIERVRQRYPFSLRLINIEEDPALESKYGTEIPVIFINGSKAFKYQVNEADFEKRLKRLWKT